MTPNSMLIPLLILFCSYRPQLAADDLGMSIKDVRPRPKEAWLESSGQPYDTDDEDFINGAAGSGSGMPPSDDVDDTTFYTTAPAVTTTSTTTTIVTTVSPPSIQVEEMITATQVASNRSLWTSILAIAITFLFFR